MPGQLRERGGQVALVDSAEAGKAAGAVDQQLIPDAARVLVDDAVFREIEDRGEIGTQSSGRVQGASLPSSANERITPLPASG